MATFLGGTAWPIGWHVGFLNRPYREVVDVTRAWGRVEPWACSELPPMPLGDRLKRLAPMQSPQKRELVMAAGERWTAQLTNDLQGGGSVSWVGHLSGVLGGPAEPGQRARAPARRGARARGRAARSAG